MDETQSSLEVESNKASVRKKRKLPNSPLTLAGNTIQEYSVFSKDVDELSAQVQRMFDFLEPWQRNADRMDKAILSNAMGENGKASYSDTDDVSLASSGPIEREPSLEEELQLRLGRMTSIAKTLRFLCNKEREQRTTLFSEVQECKNRCIHLVQDLALQSQQKENAMQQSLSKMEQINEKLEQEKTSLQQTCHDIATQAKKTILSLERELTSSKEAIGQQNRQISDLSTSNDSFKEELKAEKLKLGQLTDEVADLKHQLKAAELQKRDSDMAREHYMTLLEMSLGKLRLFEEGVITARSKDRQFRSQTPDSGHISVSPDTFGTKNMELSLPSDGKKSLKSMGDSMSVTSLETLSDVSVSLTDTSRVTADDKASSTSGSVSRLVPISPIIPPRKNKKKKNFFSNPFMKKSLSLDQPDEPADRLPPIKDIPTMERYTCSTVDLSQQALEDKERDFSSTPCLFNSPPLPRTSSQPSLNLELSELHVIPPALKRHHKNRSKSHERLSDHDNFRLKATQNDKEKTQDANHKTEGKVDKMSDRHPRDKARAKSQDRGRDKSKDRSRDKSRERGRSKTRDGGKKPERQGSNKVKDKSKEVKDTKDTTYEKNPDQPGEAKVQRNASFAAMKPKKNGLVALAKDIEKRFKKKRRSKTADFAELFKNPEMLQKAKLEAGTLRSADTNDVDSYC